MPNPLKTVSVAAALALLGLGTLTPVGAQSAEKKFKSVQIPQVKPVLEYAEVVETPALTPAAPAKVAAPAPAKAPATRATVNPTPAQSAAARTEATGQAIAATRATGRSAVLKATAYNSIPNQTDSTPFITATGTRTRPGVIALSRDMLRVFPYGTRVTIQDLSGRYNFAGRVFIVEDTMHPRKTGQVDIWMPTYQEAIRFGRSTVRITALR